MNTNQIELVIHPAAAEASNPWVQVALKLLDWPFLVFVVLIVFIWCFREQLCALLSRENIMIKWGDKSILLRDLPKKIEQDIDSKFDSIEPEQDFPTGKIQEFLSKKRKDMREFVVDLPKPHAPTADPLDRMHEALMSPAFRWRTLARLATIAGISESEARQLLTSLGVEFDVNRSGQAIVKLKSR